MQIAGCSALVTGGASGLGGATVRQLAAAGAKVVIADLNQAAGEALAAEVGSAVFAMTNVADEASVAAAIATAVEQHGGLHILVNCAGIAIGERVLGRGKPHDLKRFTQVI